MSGPTNNTYTGTCHCAQVKFSFSLPTPIEEQEVHECNCSICQINGYLLVYPKVTDIHFEHSDDDVKVSIFLIHIFLIRDGRC
ncbi:hypothetical protein BDV59DRAFT_102523 [Aspergillus ambiguus]|uniref:uncharacterized protein n=1 Tax=Aspergillus ambiguus TaxID=176160 RepID=UPI003CCDD670